MELERAKRRFHELAATHGAKLQPDVGRLTRVTIESNGVSPARAAIKALRRQVPGRETQVIVEARRWASRETPPAPAAQVGPTSQAPSRPELLDVSVASRMSQIFGVDLSRVRIATNSPAATGATKAVTKDGLVHFRAGAYRSGARRRLVNRSLARARRPAAWHWRARRQQAGDRARGRSGRIARCARPDGADRVARAAGYGLRVQR